MIIPYTGCFSHVRIRALQEDDLENLRIWRSNPENTFFLKSIGEVTPQMQLKWYRQSLLEKDYYIFAIDDMSKNTVFVGSLAIYDIKNNTAEIGKMLIDQNARGKKIGYTSMNLALHIGFQKLGIETFFLEVHEDNIAAKKNYMKSGFEIRGDHPYPKGGREWDMILTRKRFYELHTETAEYVIKGI